MTKKEYKNENNKYSHFTLVFLLTCCLFSPFIVFLFFVISTRIFFKSVVFVEKPSSFFFSLFCCFKSIASLVIFGGTTITFVVFFVCLLFFVCFLRRLCFFSEGDGVCCCVAGAVNCGIDIPNFPSTSLS